MPKKYIIITLAALAAVIILIVIAVPTLGGGVEVAPKEEIKDADEPFCLLILGKDRASGLTDVMMLASFDPTEKKISVMQIPRDTYADYGSSNHKKLNTATKILGGEEKLCDFISEAFGIGVDGYLSLELDAFREAVDAVGGVEMDIPKRLYYNDPAQGLYIDIPAGKQVLDGRQAEMVIRFRGGYSRGDLDRLDMQKRFLAALFTKLKSSLTSSEAYSLAESIFPHVKTNVSLPLAVALGVEALNVDASSLAFMTLPGEATVTQSGASFYVMSQKPAQRMMEEYFYSSGSVDIEEKFRHRTNQDFDQIYCKDFDFSPTYADDLR